MFCRIFHISVRGSLGALSAAVALVLFSSSWAPAAQPVEVLRYEVTWNGQKAGHGDITTVREGNHLNVTAQAVSDGVLKAILEIWSKVQSRFTPGTFEPHWYRFHLKSNLLPNEVVDLAFNRQTRQVTVDKSKGKERENHKEKYETLYDPVGAALLLRNQANLSKPMYVDIYDGKARCRLLVTPVGNGPGPLTVKGGSYTAQGVDLKLVKLTGDKEELAKARLWFSCDRERIPLLLTSSPVVGSVRFELVQVQR